MPNLAITSTCNRSCAGCFARAVLSAAATPAWMPVDRFDRALKLLRRSGVKEARLLGGEPTLHPQFTHLAQMALERIGKVVVFSNGRIPETALEWMERQTADMLQVTVNVTGMLAIAPERPLEDTLLRLGGRAMLGVNLSARVEPLEELLGWLDRFGLKRTVRVGLTHPDVAHTNRWLHPRHYQAVGSELAAFWKQARALGARLSLDCGFVPCMFPPSCLPDLGNGAPIGKLCGPTIDVLPDGRVVSCFPLARLAGALELQASDTTHTLRDEFERRLEPFRKLGIAPDCSTCRWQSSERCAGGCVAIAAGRLVGPGCRRDGPFRETD